MKFTKSNQLRKAAHRLIPGAAHTYGKGDDQFPARSPGFIARGKGAYVWDVDGNKFLDWTMGLRTVVLGHGYKSVVDKVQKQLANGTNFPRPSTLEHELAGLLVKLIPSAEMVKFNKNGSATTSAAVKLARAYTKRDMIAMPAGGYNGSDDWCITTTPMKAGIPKAIQKLTTTFTYNDISTVKKMFKNHKNKIACVILEPASEIEPENNFLQKLKKLCRKNGTLLIFDEMITGFRWHLKGAQYNYKVTPDLATFGKAMANGFSLAALVGRKDIMNLGSIYKKSNRERVFLLTSTHGAETHSLVAAIETIRELQKQKVISHIHATGLKLKKQLNQIHVHNNLEKVLDIIGQRGGRLALKVSDYGKYSSAQITTYLYQEVISNGILFNGYFAPSYSHKEQEIKKTVAVWGYACKNLRSALDNGELVKKLIGDPIRPVFRKYN